ncbi:MAG: outer membrane lipoprotein LolB [Burkholderiales bacterium]|nr:outer membrane lipoprotein LolB [Burkholderiales bacterium]
MRSPRSQLVLEGRLSVRYEQEGKNQQLTGQFLWQQDAAQTRILLSSPTGQALAEILVTANQASLTQAGQATRSAGNVDQLTSEILGWPLPVAGLRDWLQGFALNAKGARFIASPEQDSVATLDGWHIRYASWHDNTHPKRIDLERHIDAQGADVSLRMLIDSAT